MLEFFSSIFNYPKNIKNAILFNFIAVLSYQGIFSVFTGIHLKNLGYSEGLLGSVLSFNSISIALGCILSAFLLRRVSLKKSLGAGFILLALGFFGLAFSKTFFWVVVSSSLLGLGYAIPQTSIVVVLSDNAPINDRIHIFSKNFVFQNIGVVLASYLGGVFIKYFSFAFDSEVAIPMVFIITVLLLLLGLSPISKLELTKEHKKKVSNNIYLDLKTIFSGKAFEFLKYNTLIGIGAGLVVPFFSVYLKFALNLDSSKVGLIMAISQMGLVIGGLIVPYVSKKLGRENTVIICQFLSIPFLLSIAHASSFLFVAFSFFMRSTLMNLNQPLIQNISMECVDSELKPLLSSLITLSSYLTRSISVVVAGYIMEHFSYDIPYYFTVCFYLFGTYTFWKTFSKKAK